MSNLPPPSSGPQWDPPGGPSPSTPAYAGGLPATDAYPATFRFDAPERIANWRPLVNWILAIPHLVVLYALGIVSEVLSIISWFAILFTGRLPEGWAKVQVMYMRYSARTMTYAGFLREEYPPFTFATEAADPGDDPRVRVDAVPELENRNRLTVAFRFLLAIPHILVLIALGVAAFFVEIVAFFAVLFTGRWPESLRNFVLGVMRWSLRVNAYLLLLTDRYPPFELS